MAAGFECEGNAHGQGACRIAWKNLGAQDWDAHYERVRRANLLQCRLYGEAVAALYGQRLRHGLIYCGGHLAGMVQIQEAGILNNAVHAVVLDRGPLWFDGFGSEQDFRNFMTAFAQEFPRRFGRRARIIPEIGVSQKVEESMMQAGYRRKSRGGYQTVWLDLRPALEDLRAGLKKNWRGSLRKGERARLQVHWDDEGVSLPRALEGYRADRRKKGYDGPSEKLLQALGKKFLRGKHMLIGHAALDGRASACIVVLCHGKSATYQMGWVSEKGREEQAGHVLLWDAIRVLKERNINDFDLGGVNDDSARGVKSFKIGMGGERIEIPGLYV